MEQLPFFVIILAAFYLLIIRPQRTRAKAARELQAGLAPGVEVMTTAGLYGRVTEVRDDSLLLEVSPGVTVRFAKAAVGRIVPDGAVDDDTTDDATDGDSSETGPSGTEPRRSNAAE